MKTFLKYAMFTSLMLLGSMCHAGSPSRYTPASALGPVQISTTSNAKGYWPGTTLAAPTTGTKNCLTSVVATSTNTFKVQINDASTLIFDSGFTAANGTFNKEWPYDDPLCASALAALTITSTSTASPSTMSYSYQGYVAQ